MSEAKLQMSRKQLAAICKDDPEAIRLMERLFSAGDAVTADSVWHAYTPASYQGLGTPSAVNLWYKSDGHTLEIQGDLTLGTVTASEARIDLPSGFAAAADYTASVLTLVGYEVPASTGTDIHHVLIGPGSTYLNFGYRASGATGLAAQTGSVLFATENRISINATIRI